MLDFTVDAEAGCEPAAGAELAEFGAVAGTMRPMKNPVTSAPAMLAMTVNDGGKSGGGGGLFVIGMAAEDRRRALLFPDAFAGAILRADYFRVVKNGARLADAAHGVTLRRE